MFIVRLSVQFISGKFSHWFYLIITLLGIKKLLQNKNMVFTFGAASYIVALIADAFLIFFSIFHVIAFDELKTDYK